MNFKAFLCAILIASLVCMVHAKASFPSGYETSSVSTRSFSEVSTETEDDDYFDCDDVPQLMITIVPSERRGDYSVTMYVRQRICSA